MCSSQLTAGGPGFLTLFVLVLAVCVIAITSSDAAGRRTLPPDPGSNALTEEASRPPRFLPPSGIGVHRATNEPLAWPDCYRSPDTERGGTDGEGVADRRVRRRSGPDRLRCRRDRARCVGWPHGEQEPEERVHHRNARHDAERDPARGRCDQGRAAEDRRRADAKRRSRRSAEHLHHRSRHPRARSPGSRSTTAAGACFGNYMRIHALGASNGLTYAQMGQYAAKPDAPVQSTDFNGGTSDTKYAQVDPTTGRPVSNGARNVWASETSLTTASISPSPPARSRCSPSSWASRCSSAESGS